MGRIKSLEFMYEGMSSLFAEPDLLPSYDQKSILSHREYQRQRITEAKSPSNRFTSDPWGSRIIGTKWHHVSQSEVTDSVRRCSHKR